MEEFSILRGKLPTALANAVSDAISAAIGGGMEPDEACCVVASVAADYGRAGYGPAYLDQLAEVVRARRTYPMPGRAT